MDFLLFYDQRASRRCFFVFTLFFLLVAGVFFVFCRPRVTFFPWRKKVTKERHLRGEGFRFPSPLKKPLTLKRPKREGCGPPSLETPSGGLGDYQIAPLPRSGKGRWRPKAAI